MVHVVRADRPRVERDRAHLRAPRDDGDLGRADLVRVPAGGELDPRRLHVVGSARHDALLVEGVALLAVAGGELEPGLDALRPALERRRPVAQRAHDPVLDRQVVLDHVELRDRVRALGRGEDLAVGARHPHLAPAGVHGHCSRGSHLREASQDGRARGGPGRRHEARRGRDRERREHPAPARRRRGGGDQPRRRP